MFFNTVFLGQTTGNRAGRKAVFVMLSFILAGICHTPSIFAQLPSPQHNSSQARTQVLTRPAGAIVFFKGEYSVAARAPYTVTHFLRGPYQIKAKLHGYEDWNSNYFFNGQGNEKLSIRLKPKTRLKSFMRSLIVPGWGQNYSDQRIKGIVIGLAQLVAAGIFLRHEIRYQNAVDDLQAAKQAFKDGRDDELLRNKLAAAQNAAQKKADNRFRLRRRWAIIGGSIYFYNLIDALIFFPSYNRKGLELGMAISPPPGQFAVGSMVGVRARF